MTYESYDVSVQDASPVHLIEIVYQNITYRFTTRPNDVTAMSQTWTSKNIQFGEIEITNEINKNNIDLDFPATDAFALQFLTQQIEYVTTVTLYRGYESDGNYIAYWKGRVNSMKVKRNTLTLVCESVFTSLKRPGLRRRFTKTCGHVLYERGCNLELTSTAVLALAVSDQVTSISTDGETITVPACSAEADGYYTGGIVQASDGVKRWIKNHTGSTLTLASGYDGFASTTDVTVYPGCDYTFATCVSRFDNGDNCGCFLLTPQRVPFNGNRI